MKEPMSQFDFTHYINASKKESDWIDNFYKLGFDGLADKIFSYDNTISLISKIFHDNSDILHDWIYETNYGRDDNVKMIYDNQHIKTITDIYNLLIKNYNKEIDFTDIIIEG